MGKVRVRAVYLMIWWIIQAAEASLVISEREVKFTFAICHRPSVCRLSSVVCL